MGKDFAWRWPNPGMAEERGVAIEEEETVEETEEDVIAEEEEIAIEIAIAEMAAETEDPTPGGGEDLRGRKPVTGFP